MQRGAKFEKELMSNLFQIIEKEGNTHICSLISDHVSKFSVQVFSTLLPCYLVQLEPLFKFEEFRLNVRKFPIGKMRQFGNFIYSVEVLYAGAKY